ncbi:methyl-accepting chemotaxis protein [Paenibacillus spongiae]|uniref:Methyl-accepting chemotaxis protein n=1 Tax=Paenibacillus spongiae TaxID=2909671 RepID=A0ABY5SCJ2_9BACL|nr:methyl-accepting chemotaxis protein [Paenibacillus spongiae]UVI31253.1 methyl-accepting chemotaxis protein [Paenibacillus spongiae]
MSWFYNLKTSVKLVASFLILSMVMIFVGLYGMSNLKNLNNNLTDMYDNNLLPVSYLIQTNADLNEMRVIIRDLYIHKNPEKRAANVESYKNVKNKIEQQMDKFNNTVLSDNSKQAMQAYDGLWKNYNDIYEKAVDLSFVGQEAEMLQLMTEDLPKAGGEIRALIEKLVQYNIDEANQFNRDGKALYKSSNIITISIVIAATILCIVFGTMIARIISRPLNKVMNVVGKVAEGDLNERLNIRTKDEIGHLARSVDGMVDNLRRIVGSILHSSENVSAASQQIYASTEEIASGNASQADAAQAINELFSDLSSAIHSVAQNTEAASELSNTTVTVAREGSDVIQSSAESMNAVSTQMSRLEEDSQRIGEIIEVIEDIADQTNLLALNAAIEAARAGEQGRGFAVVADEVRKLAERSGDATKQIAGIIKGMQDNTRMSVNAVQESVRFSRQTEDAFRKIVTMVNDSGHMVMEIAAASEEQAAQASSVILAVENISAATEENAASSEETAATAQSLAKLSEELQNAVSIFKINDAR